MTRGAVGFWNVKWPKRRRDRGSWCPVCRRPGLHQPSTWQDWKCAACGSRIPHETLMCLIRERIEILQLRVAESEEEG